jgi:lycopene cyclase domain-containing protein
VTYPRTLLFFVLPPLLALTILLWRRGRLDRSFGASLGVLLVVVYAATSPWDNLAVRWGIWHFDPAKTWPIRIFYLPLEEYLFFGLQSILAALVWRLLARGSGQTGARSP